MTIALFMDPPLFGNTRIEKYTPDRIGTFAFLFTATIFNAQREFRKKTQLENRTNNNKQEQKKTCSENILEIQ